LIGGCGRLRFGSGVDGRGRRGRRRWIAGCPGFAEAEPVAQIIESEGVRQRGSVTAGPGGLIGLEDLVKDPSGDEEAKDAVLIHKTDENREDDQVDDSLGVLPVVHRSHTRDKAKQSRQAGVWFAIGRRRGHGRNLGPG
jgi:hypothetical protein